MPTESTLIKDIANLSDDALATFGCECVNYQNLSNYYAVAVSVAALRYVWQNSSSSR